MSDEVVAAETAPRKPVKNAGETVFGVIVAIAACHGLNDMMQSLLPAIYPNFKASLGLTFGQIGLVTLAYQVTASILQPLIGFYADKRPTPMALPGGTLFSLAGLTVLSTAHSYGVILVGACLLGMGSSVFHPEASRVARMAAGPRPGLAQALFQVGGNVGSAIGPLAAAIFVVRYGQSSLAVFALMALLSGGILWNVGLWYKHHGLARLKAGAKAHDAHPPLPRGKAALGLLILVTLIFSKFVYLASITSYFTFYLIHQFGASVRTAQLHLFLFMAAVAAGTILGGPLGDKLGRKTVIWFSILGALPFTLLLPHVDLFWTGPLTVVIGLILASAFPAIVVFAQELAPGNVGMVAGLCFGLSFGLGGIGAGVLGWLADLKGIAFVYQVCAFLPAIGLLAGFLPNVEKPRAQAAKR
jgi:FSR family fosmidomycin resistance protein-like MFS transporter